MCNPFGGLVPVTIKDIAKVAGVSHTTVSRALKSNPAISPEKQVAQDAGYSVFLSCCYNDPEREVAVVETFQRRRVDAIIVTASRVGSLYSLQLDQIRVPIVLINNQEEGEYLHSVAIDDMQGAQLAVEHLLALGHRQIGYIGTVGRPKSNERRLAGYCTALERAGLIVNPALIVSPASNDDIEQGQAGLNPLVAQGATAIFCYNDRIAIGLLMACRQRGLSVPHQLSLIGFDDIEPALYTTPPLTTIHQPRIRLGQLAMTMTLDLLNGQAVYDQVIPCELVVRESTSPPPSELPTNGRTSPGLCT
ncbi:MAG: LacI family DNA-binding transcriptional regulator [Chloroflexi bacterium]|nr:LacI family DNA-binding transcriptional regulator [Chloroflexota bacterium]